MFSPDSKPRRRWLYREDSHALTPLTDVSPRNDGHLLTSTRKHEQPASMAEESRKLLVNEGVLYKYPDERIKYTKRIGDDPMSRYLHTMNQLNVPGGLNPVSTRNDRGTTFTTAYR